MLILDVPGFARLELKHLVLDFNGTLAVDGRMIDGVGAMLAQLAPNLDLHVLTADTFGSVKREFASLQCKINRISPAEQDTAKRDYVRTLGPQGCVAIGNGRNDALMVREAMVGIALLQEEGLASACMMSADILCRSIQDALGLLVRPRRLMATLRC
jgi:soluble P-type ATPase